MEALLVSFGVVAIGEIGEHIVGDFDLETLHVRPSLGSRNPSAIIARRAIEVVVDTFAPRA